MLETKNTILVKIIRAPLGEILFYRMSMEDSIVSSFEAWESSHPLPSRLSLPKLLAWKISQRSLTPQQI